MFYERDYQIEFREGEENCCVQARGYLNYFQDMATELTHSLRLGNDTLNQDYGVSWIYTKYRIHIFREADFTRPLHMKTWVEDNGSASIMLQDIEMSADDGLYMTGRLEQCLMDLEKGRLTRLSAINLPPDLYEKCEPKLGGFTRFPRVFESLIHSYTYIVRYSDLDMNHHMTNLRYVPMLVDAFDSAFYKKYRICDFEIHYVGQSFEGDAIDVGYEKIDDESYYLTGTKTSGELCAIAKIFIEKR